MLPRSGRFHPVHLQVQWSSSRLYPDVRQTVNVPITQKGCSACCNIPGSLCSHKTARSRSWYVQRVRTRCSKPPLPPRAFMEQWLMEGSYKLSFVQNVYSLVNISLYYVTRDVMKSKPDLSDTSKYFLLHSL